MTNSYTPGPLELGAFAFHARTRVVFDVGAIERLGALSHELGVRRVLVVTDPGVAAAGHIGAARTSLEAAGVEVAVFDGVEENPTSALVDRCAAFAREAGIDGFIGLGGGSAMDTAKGANIILTNGGRMPDYLGYGRATKPMLPLVAVPTTAGTGSESQSYTLISDDDTHRKMACGAPGVAAKIALLDPALTVSQPREVTAATGIDAITHAVETAVTTKRNAMSAMFSTEAFRLMSRAFERVLETPDDLEARAAMQLGAAYAGTAIELSMLGAAHSSANPLTARFDVTHGPAVGVMLPHVVRFNGDRPDARARYRDLMVVAGEVPREDTPEVIDVVLADRVTALLEAAGLPTSIASYGVTADAIPELARDAASQWTARYNPRPITAGDFETLYHRALDGAL